MASLTELAESLTKNGKLVCQTVFMLGHVLVDIVHSPMIPQGDLGDLSHIAMHC